MDRRIVLRTKLSLECRFERSERNMALVNVREVMGKMFGAQGKLACEVERRLQSDRESSKSDILR